MPGIQHLLATRSNLSLYARHYLYLLSTFHNMDESGGLLGVEKKLSRNFRLKGVMTTI